jgi:UDP-N-acetylglucosamine 2-epimerase (non-hydrolysing)
MSVFEKTKIACVVGTRPEAIKMAPLILALREDPAFETRVLASGQHSDMMTRALDHFGIGPDVNLNVMKDRSNSRSHHRLGIEGNWGVSGREPTEFGLFRDLRA